MDKWSGWLGLIAVAALFGINKSIINSLLKGDENMEEKIARIKELILDKVMSKVESETLTIDDYNKIVYLVGQVSYDPKNVLPYLEQAFNSGSIVTEEK